MASSSTYCGPATAHLSVFPRVTYRHGSCTSTTRNDFSRLTVSIGTRTLSSRTNGGRAYFNLELYGAPPHAISGDVLAYAKGKRWTGVGLSFNVPQGSGTFVARGINGSRGTARGSFRC